jgi:hypothetical protein
MEFNRPMNTAPRDVQYLIFDLLNYIEITRVIKAIGIHLDAMYWQRRHRRDFAAVRAEINAIDHSIETHVIGLFRKQISTVSAGDYTTRYALPDLHTNLPQIVRGATNELTINSNKVKPYMQDTMLIWCRYWYHRLDCDFTITRSNSTKYYKHTNMLHTVIIDNCVTITRYNG